MAEAEDRESHARPNIFQKGSDQEALARTLATIKALGLNDNLIELDTLGYTTIEGALSDNQVSVAREAILDRVERDTGKRIDPQTATAEDFAGMSYLPYMLYDHQIFQEILLLPKPLAMITYLLGESCVLSSIGSHFKGQGAHGVIPLHSDAGNGIPPPLPPHSLVANVNYALTPYSREAGALAVVPGSHKLARQPTLPEMSLGGETSNPQAVSMDLKPGDAVVWHGNTWHGSFPREIPGARINLAAFFSRQYIVTQERHKGVAPAEVLERHADNPRFKRLLGYGQPYGWQGEGPNYTMMAQAPKGLYD